MKFECRKHKRFVATKVTDQARVGGVVLSDAERRMFIGRNGPRIPGRCEPVRATRIQGISDASTRQRSRRFCERTKLLEPTARIRVSRPPRWIWNERRDQCSCSQTDACRHDRTRSGTKLEAWMARFGGSSSATAISTTELRPVMASPCLNQAVGTVDAELGESGILRSRTAVSRSALFLRFAHFRLRTSLGRRS